MASSAAEANAVSAAIDTVARGMAAFQVEMADWMHWRALSADDWAAVQDRAREILAEKGTTEFQAAYALLAERRNG